MTAKAETAYHFHCPKCGGWLTVYAEGGSAYCWHYGTPHDTRGKSALPSKMLKSELGPPITRVKRKKGNSK